MGIAIDEPVQNPHVSDAEKSQAGGAGGAYPELRAGKEKGSVHSVSFAHAAAPQASGAPCLEDVLAYADAQYANNDVINEGDKVSSQQAILKSPLRFVWGPASPALTAPVQLSQAAPDLSSKDVELEAQVAKELENRRALRKVTAFGAFYLITTDILGPFNTGYAYSTVGFVPGAILYTVMGIVAWYCGNLLLTLYLRLDSDRYPVRNYGQLVNRILGPYGRALSDILVIIQLVVNCGTLLLSNAQSMAQIIDGAGKHLCFAVAIVVFVIINFLLSPIRSLKGVGFFANSAVFLNTALIFCTIGFVTSSPPFYAAAEQAYGIPAGPVKAVAFVQASLESKVNGIQNMIFAYGGAQIFIDFISEMKRPWDFWKSMSCAQLFICCMYQLLGIVVYAKQGQFTQSLAYYGVSPYSERTVGNVIAIITGIIAALLYGNIAQKLCYSTIVERWCNGPALMTARGWKFWLLVNVVFWPIAFVIGAAIPQIQTISGLVAAIAILQFSYTFPFLCKWAFDIQVFAMAADPPHTVGTVPQRVDTWRSTSRWRRALFGGSARAQLINWAHFILFLASLSMACLGMWGSGKSIQETFKSAAATSFGCASPT